MSDLLIILRAFAPVWAPLLLAAVLWFAYEIITAPVEPEEPS